MPREPKAGLYPVFLDLKGLRVLIAGGGKVAARKLKGLPKSAKVTLIAPEILPGLGSRARLLRRPVRLSDVDAADLVFTATDDPALNDRLARRALSKRRLVCAAHKAGLGNFQTPAVARAGAYRLAISTGGSNPAAAKALKSWLEARLKGARIPKRKRP